MWCIAGGDNDRVPGGHPRGGCNDARERRHELERGGRVREEARSAAAFHLGHLRALQPCQGIFCYFLFFSNSKVHGDTYSGTNSNSNTRV